MKEKNICDTLNIYGITYRKRKWTIKDVVSVLINFRKLNYDNEMLDPETGLPMTKSKMRKLSTTSDKDVDSLCVDFNSVLSSENDENTVNNQNEWLCIYYNPAIGLPPNIKIPKSFKLPDSECTIYIPKI